MQEHWYEWIFCLHYFSVALIALNSSVFVKTNIWDISSKPRYSKINTKKTFGSIQWNDFLNSQTKSAQNSYLRSSKTCKRKATASWLSKKDFVLCFKLLKSFPFSSDLLKYLLCGRLFSRFTCHKNKMVPNRATHHIYIFIF